MEEVFNFSCRIFWFHSFYVPFDYLKNTLFYLFQHLRVFLELKEAEMQGFVRKDFCSHTSITAATGFSYSRAAFIFHIRLRNKYYILPICSWQISSEIWSHADAKGNKSTVILL